MRVLAPRSAVVCGFASALVASVLLAVLLPTPAEAGPPIDGRSLACNAIVPRLPTGFTIPEPGWVWVNPSEKLKDVSGTVTKSDVSHTDFPAIHDSHDQNTDIRVDPGFEGLLSDANDPGMLDMEWETGTFPSETSGDPPERTFPRWAWPSVGDRVWINGNWIFDCGHPKDIGGASHYHTEIHPPRAIASMRSQMHTLPGSGATPVPVTATDLYIHGRAGFVMDDLTCGQAVVLGAGTCTPVPYPGRGTPIDADYEFKICLPPRPSPTAQLRWSMTLGPGNTLGVNPILTAEPAAGVCAGPSRPRQIDVRIPLAGTSASPDDVLARKIYAGWVFPSDGLEHLTVKLTKGKLFNDQEISGGDCECSFFWLNVDQANDEWFRLTPFQIPTDDHAGFLCAKHINTLNAWDDNSGCGDGFLDFSGPTFDFYVANGRNYTLRTVAYDQDCYDVLFGHHILSPSVVAALAACTFPGNGDNDPYSQAVATDIAVGPGQQVSNPPRDFTLFFDVARIPLTTEDRADLRLRQACKPNTHVHVNQPIICRITITNSGPGLPQNVTVRVMFKSDTPNLLRTIKGPSFTIGDGGISTRCEQTVTISGGREFECHLGTVPIGTTAAVTYYLDPHETGKIVERASVSTTSTDPNPSNNSDQAEVSVTK